MNRILWTTILLGLAACDKSGSPQEASGRAEDRREVATSEAGNTKKNQRDVDPDVDTKTPLDQGENEVDRTITADIRKAVVGDSAMSMSAKNAKIITKDGVVTLRGPVASDAEKKSIETLATKTVNVKRVDNQLEVKTD